MSERSGSQEEKEVFEAYQESLVTLVANARHVIMNLTEIAHEYSKSEMGHVVVSVIESHLRRTKNEYKLPCLYLMDSIIKNHEVPYRELFQQNIVSTFAGVFHSAPENIRSLLFKLRNTWNSIFTPTKLFQLDKKIKSIDPAWPMPPNALPNIHINPAVFNRSGSSVTSSNTNLPSNNKTSALNVKMTDDYSNETMMEAVRRKERELLELKQKKLELELEAARKEVRDQQLKAEKEAALKIVAAVRNSSSEKQKDEKSKVSKRDPRVRDESESREPLTNTLLENEPETDSKPGFRKELKNAKKRPRNGSDSSPSVIPIKNLARIPKKVAKHSEEIPEENSPVRTNNKRRNKGETESPPGKKKKDLLCSYAEENMGKENVKQQVTPLPSPSIGWAKFKEVNPDEYRTPIRNRRNDDRFDIGNDFQGPSSGVSGLHHRRRGLRDPMGRQTEELLPPSHFTNGFESSEIRSSENRHFFEMMLHNASRVNPEVVRNDVIPTIVREAQEALRSSRMTQGQFSDLMRQVMTLKEQAMMVQADQRYVEPFQRPPPIPFFNPSLGTRPPPPPPLRPQHNRDLPPASPEDLELIRHDPVKTIPIDHEPRDIRLYDEVCCIVMGDDDVRELSFQPGETRRVIIDESITVVCELDVKYYVDFTLDGVVHKMKIGAPTRELWIDGQWNECFFDNSVRVRVGQSFHTFYLEGPAPKVKIGDKRSDLCPGRVNLIIDADLKSLIPIYLDAKPQRFDIGAKPHVLRFVESLKIVLINGHPYRTEFGGVPMVVFVEGIKHYVRLTVLPKNLHPGNLCIANMTSMSGGPTGGPKSPPTGKSEPRLLFKTPSPPPLDNDNSNLDNVDNVGKSSAFDKLLTLFPKQHKLSQSEEKEKEDHESYTKDSLSNPPNSESYNSEEPESSSLASTDKSVDVHNLWSQLLGAGLVSTKDERNDSIPGLDVSLDDEETKMENGNQPQSSESKSNTTKNSEKSSEPSLSITPIVLKSHHKTLKTRQLGIINELYDPSALQCKNCGLRYSHCDMMAYSQHLDWHFRLKRREKDNARKAQSTRWYIERLDWIISDEIEEFDKELESQEESLSKISGKQEIIPSVPAGKIPPENTCPICKEEFEQFYKDDSEEEGKWMLYNAVVHQNQIFHPQCLQDQKHVEEEEDSVLSSNDDSYSGVKNKRREKKEHEEEDVVVKEEENVKEEKENEEDDKKETEMNNIKLEIPDEESKEKEEEESKEKTEDDEMMTKTIIKNEKREEETTIDNNDNKGDSNSNQEHLSNDRKAAEETENQMTSLEGIVDKSPAVPTVPKSIRLNLSKPVSRSASLSPPLPETQKTIEESDFDVDAIIQSSSTQFTDDEYKPKLKGRKMDIMPIQHKDGELSGLCLIM